jgi:DNA-binding CsgD family transcriptional regulator
MSPDLRLVVDVEPARTGPAGLRAVQRRLQAAETVGELFARAADEACGACGFDRGLVLTVDGAVLRPLATSMSKDPASDALRRQALATPIALSSTSLEAELLRQVEGARPGLLTRPSAVAEVLGLGGVALAAIAPEAQALGLLVLDRATGPVTDADRDGVELMAILTGLALERLVARQRLDHVTAELRHLTASANAAIHEARHAPTSLPDEHGPSAIFPAREFGAGPVRGLVDVLTPREADVAALLVEGRSNREIAAALCLSPQTVKGYVARVVRKLGATNRVDAVRRYLQLAQ